MAMPMDYDGMRTDDASERTDNVTDYKRTCIDFIEDISGSYLEWVDLYTKRNEIPIDEDKKRRKEIASIIEKTNTGILSHLGSYQVVRTSSLVSGARMRWHPD